MREIIKDFKREGFSRMEAVIFGVVFPIGLVTVCALTEALVRWVVCNSI